MDVFFWWVYMDLELAWACTCSQVDDFKCDKWNFIRPISGFFPIPSPSLVMHHLFVCKLSYAVAIVSVLQLKNTMVSLCCLRSACWCCLRPQFLPCTTERMVETPKISENNAINNRFQLVQDFAVPSTVLRFSITWWLRSSDHPPRPKLTRCAGETHLCSASAGHGSWCGSCLQIPGKPHE